MAHANTTLILGVEWEHLGGDRYATPSDSILMLLKRRGSHVVDLRLIVRGVYDLRWYKRVQDSERPGLLNMTSALPPLLQLPSKHPSPSALEISPDGTHS